MPITLYTIVPSRGSIVHWMLEELGQPYSMKVLDGKKEENRQSGYLRINPLGKVPALDHDGVIITEVSAICCYLADRYPQAKLSMPIDDPRRGPYLKWLFFGPSVLEPHALERALKREPPPRGMAGWGDFDLVMDHVAKSVSQSEYLFGSDFSAADVVVGSQLRWGMQFGMFPRRDEFASYVARLERRPALAKVIAAEAKMQERA